MDESVKIDKELKKINERVDQVSNQLTVLKHEYRLTNDDALKLEIQKRWNELQKKMSTLVKKREKIVEKKNEIDYKAKWNINSETVINYF